MALKKLAQTIAEDIARNDGYNGVHFTTAIYSITIEKNGNGKYALIVKDIDNRDLIFKISPYLVNIEQDSDALCEQCEKHNIKGDDKTLLFYMLEAWYYGDVR